MNFGKKTTERMLKSIMMNYQIHHKNKKATFMMNNQGSWKLKQKGEQQNSILEKKNFNSITYRRSGI